jgi:HPt (histidine-containing phosphotransfer) domain-containing protein
LVRGNETNRISALRNVVNADAEAEPALATLDLPFLAQQTFDDADLAREVLILFADQARRVVPTLPNLAPEAQREAAHLLKGSARGIGAWAAAAIAEAYETAAPEARSTIHGDLAATFAATQTAIARELA